MLCILCYECILLKYNIINKFIENIFWFVGKLIKVFVGIKCIIRVGYRIYVYWYIEIVWWVLFLYNCMVYVFFIKKKKWFVFG